MDIWDFKVKVIRTDGSVREIPYPSWNQELADRMTEAGFTFELPELPTESMPVWYGCENVRKPPKITSSPISALSDSELIDILSDVEEELTEKEAAVCIITKEYYMKFGFLTQKNRKKAERLAKKYGVS